MKNLKPYFAFSFLPKSSFLYIGMLLVLYLFFNQTKNNFKDLTLFASISLFIIFIIILYLLIKNIRHSSTIKKEEKLFKKFCDIKLSLEERKDIGWDLLLYHHIEREEYYEQIIIFAYFNDYQYLKDYAKRRKRGFKLVKAFKLLKDH